ncbi:MAG TPA: hypothetical protein VFF52_29885, partial [Isosphaeraceae bacterium]|nr:hypothetical protein [Isosphaeraceae bacterium]
MDNPPTAGSVGGPVHGQGIRPQWTGDLALTRIIRRWTGPSMKRTFAVVAFLACLGALLKLAARPM